MLNNKIKILCIVLLIFVFGCKEGLYNDEKFIRNLSDDKDFGLPLVNESLIIFIAKNDLVYTKSLRQLYTIKESKYQNFEDFDSFLIEAINNDLLSKEDLENYRVNFFTLNRKIEDEFKRNGIEYLKKTYCQRSNANNKFYIKSNLELDLQKSIMYFFFKNNYFIMLNDYSGKYVVIDKN